MIGIYGGTFDPIHYGHLRTAIEVKELFALQELRLIPSHQPPHRDRPGASPQNRLEMLQLAIKGQDGLQIDSRELRRDGPSFMVDTLQSLKSEYPAHSLLLIMGSDAFASLTGWHRWQSLFDYAHIVVMSRPSSEINEMPECLKTRQLSTKKELADQLAGGVYFQNVTPLDISASKIRQIIKEKRNPAFLLPNQVISYIQRYKLYQDN